MGDKINLDIDIAILEDIKKILDGTFVPEHATTWKQYYKSVISSLIGVGQASDLDNRFCMAVLLFGDSDATKRVRIARLNVLFRIYDDVLRVRGQFTGAERKLSEIIAQTVGKCKNEVLLDVVADKLNKYLQEERNKNFNSSAQSRAYQNIGGRSMRELNMLNQESKESKESTEVKFLATAYYKLNGFAKSQMLSQAYAEKQFSAAVQDYIDNGKISKNSANLFSTVIRGKIVEGNLLSLSKTDFDKEIQKILNNRQRALSGGLREQFRKMLKSQGIEASGKEEQLGYAGLLLLLGEISGSPDYRNIAEQLIQGAGATDYRIASPINIVVASDGCSHTTWGSIYRHLGKLR